MPTFQPILRKRSNGTQSMFDGMDDEQRPVELCGSATIYHSEGAVRLFCGRRDCPTCYNYRKRMVAAKIRRYAQKSEHTMYWMKIPSTSHRSVVSAIKSIDGEYACFPLKENGLDIEIIVSDVIEGHPVHLDDRIYDRVDVWAKTPRGRKMSFSSGFCDKQKASGEPKKKTFFAKISVHKIVPYAERIGAKVTKRTANMVAWSKIDPDELTLALCSDEIEAFQLTMFTDATEPEESNFDDDLSECKLPHNRDNTPGITYPHEFMYQLKPEVAAMAMQFM